MYVLDRAVTKVDKIRMKGFRIRSNDSTDISKYSAVVNARDPSSVEHRV